MRGPRDVDRHAGRLHGRRRIVCSLAALTDRRANVLWVILVLSIIRSPTSSITLLALNKRAMPMARCAVLFLGDERAMVPRLGCREPDCVGSSARWFGDTRVRLGVFGYSCRGASLDRLPAIKGALSGLLCGSLRSPDRFPAHHPPMNPALLAACLHRLELVTFFAAAAGSALASSSSRVTIEALRALPSSDTLVSPLLLRDDFLSRIGRR